MTTLVSRAEEVASSSLRTALDSVSVGASILDSPNFDDYLAALTRFVPALLEELYPYWKWETMDQIWARVAVKTAEREAEFIGMCDLMSDWSEIPMHVSARYADSVDEIEWMRCRLGVPGNGDGGMQRFLGDSGASEMIHRVVEDPEAVNWVFTVTLGEETVT